MTDAELDAMIAELREPYKWPKPCIKAADAIAALRKEIKRLEAASDALLEHANDCDEAAVTAEADNAALRKVLHECVLIVGEPDQWPGSGKLGCSICELAWFADEPEAHFPNCFLYDATLLAGKEKA